MPSSSHIKLKIPSHEPWQGIVLPPPPAPVMGYMYYMFTLKNSIMKFKDSLVVFISVIMSAFIGEDDY